MQTLQEIPLNEIVSNRYQPRTRFVEDEIKELADSIRQVGLLHPPAVTKILGTAKYEIVAGERRIMACRYLGLSNVTCIVKAATSLQHTAQAALIENVQRVDLNPVEIARSIKILMEDFGISQEEIAVKIGKKRSTVANYLRILQLPEEMQEAISLAKISHAHAKVLLSCTGQARQKLFQKMLSEQLTVQSSSKIAKSETSTCLHYKELEDRLRRHFATRIEVTGVKDKGTITLHFFSLDDLDRVLEKMQLEDLCG